MPLESLPNKLGSIPSQPVPNFQAPQVFPTGDIAKQGMDMLSHIVDALSPLSKAERKAKLAQLGLMTDLYHRAKGGDQKAIDAIFGHATKNVLTPSQIYTNAKARAMGQKSGEGGSAAAAAVRMRLALDRGQTSAEEPVVNPRPTGRVDTLSDSLLNQ